MHSQSAKSFQELAKLARNYSMGAVPDEYRESLPIPVHLDSGVAIEFFFAPSLARPKQPVELFAPAFALTMHNDGSLIRLWRVSPRDFGLNDDPARPLGLFGLRDGWTYEDYNQRYTRLLESLDALLPQFAAQNVRPSGETRSVAREYLTLFKELAEPPLNPYYDAAGNAFFAWVRNTSR